MALKLYGSNSEAEMLDLGGNVLYRLEAALNKSKHLSQAEFFAVCVLDMISRASEMAANHLPVPSHHGDIQATTYSSPGICFRKSKTLEVLFGLIRPTSDYNAFEAISKATGGKAHERVKDGMDLLTHVETCLFNIKPFHPRFPQNTESLRIHLPSQSSSTVTGPGRLALEMGRKRGLSAESKNQQPGFRAGSRQPLPINSYRTVETENGSESHSGED